jgi:hypothetical protein
MKQFAIFALMCGLLGPLHANAQSVDLWRVFERVSFDVQYNEEANGYFYYPEFGQEIKALEGKIVRITGHYLPYDFEGFFIVSKVPYASCFFCGGAGPESVVAIMPKGKMRKFRSDEVITLEGRLKLNRDDIDQFNFILIDAELVSN